jgi:integrase
MTGMRLSEQLTLEWEEIDLGAGTIHLEKSKNGSGRFVRLNSRALAVLRMMHARGLGTGRVFPAKVPRWFRAAGARSRHQGFFAGIACATAA